MPSWTLYTARVTLILSTRWQHRARSLSMKVVCACADRSGEHDIATMAAKMARRRHHPPHSQQSADLLSVARGDEAGTHHLLEGDHVGADRREHICGSCRQGTAIETAAPVHVVGGDPDVGVRLHRLSFTRHWPLSPETLIAAARGSR